MKRIAIFLLLCMVAGIVGAATPRPKKTTRKRATPRRAVKVAPKPVKLTQHDADPFHACEDTCSHVHGIDVSHYQNEVFWNAVGDDTNMAYVYLKCTEGSDNQDPLYLRNIELAHSHDLKVGSYHFFRPKSNLSLQMHNFKAQCLPAEQDLIPMIDVETIVPGGILCMYSAWAYYELTTKLPPSICVAIEKKRKVILPDYPSVSLYYWSKSVLEIGVTKQKIDDYTVRIYDLEKSVCDAVKFRNKIGIDLSSEILKNYLKRTDRNITRLNEYGKRMRLASTMNSLIDYLV